MPTKVFLAKGEKRQLVFWTDQDYSQTTTESDSQPDSEDPFLEFVNSNKQSDEESPITQVPEIEIFTTQREDLAVGGMDTTLEQGETSEDITTEVSVGETTTVLLDSTTVELLPQETHDSQITTESMEEDIPKETEEIEITTEFMKELQQITELQEMTTLLVEEMSTVTEAIEPVSLVTERTIVTEFITETADTTLAKVDEMLDEETTTMRGDDEEDGSGAGETTNTKIIQRTAGIHTLFTKIE